MHKTALPTKWVKEIKVQQMWHNISNVKCFRDIEVTDLGKWQAGKVWERFVFFILWSLNGVLTPSIWTYGELDETFKVHNGRKAWDSWFVCKVEGWMRSVWGRCFEQCQALEFVLDFIGNFIIHLVPIIHFYLFGKHLLGPSHVENNGLDTGPRKMYKIWFIPSKLYTLALLRNTLPQKNQFHTLQTCPHFRRPMKRHINAFYLILLNSYITTVDHAPAACGYERSNTDTKAQIL